MGAGPRPSSAGAPHGPLLGVGHMRTDAFLNLARQNERRWRPRGWPTLCPVAVSLPLVPTAPQQCRPPEPSPRAGVNAQQVSAVACGPRILPAGQGTAETVSALVLSEAHSTSPATSARSRNCQDPRQKSRVAMRKGRDCIRSPWCGP